MNPQQGSHMHQSNSANYFLRARRGEEVVVVAVVDEGVAEDEECPRKPPGHAPPPPRVRRRGEERERAHRDARHSAVAELGSGQPARPSSIPSGDEFPGVSTRCTVHPEHRSGTVQ